MDYSGSALMQQGHYKDAEAIHRETLVLSKKLLGSEHSNTLLSMDYLGVQLAKLDRYKEAEMIHRETLVLRKKVLGSEHPETLTTWRTLDLH
jgi:hypothetical protein